MEGRGPAQSTPPPRHTASPSTSKGLGVVGHLQLQLFALPFPRPNPQSSPPPEPVPQCPRQLPGSGSGPFALAGRCLCEGGLVSLLPQGAAWEGRSGMGDLRFHAAPFRSLGKAGRDPCGATAGSPLGTAGITRSKGGPGSLLSPHHLPNRMLFYWKCRRSGSGRDMKASRELQPSAALRRVKAALPAAAIAFLSATPSCRRCHRPRHCSGR